MNVVLPRHKKVYDTDYTMEEHFFLEDRIFMKDVATK